MKSPVRSFRSLAAQFLVFQLLVVAVVLVAVAAVSVAQSTREFRDVRGQRMIAVAENMASTPIVRDRYADPFAGRVLAPEVDRAVALSGAGLAEILDPDGTVRVSSDPSRIGQRMDLEPSRADEGRAWFGDDDIDGVHSLVGQVPMLSTNGDVLAVASVSEPYPSVWELLSGAGRAPAVLPQPRRGVGPGGVLAVVAAHQTAHPWTGDRRDRQPGRTSGSIAAQHP